MSKIKQDMSDIAGVVNIRLDALMDEMCEPGILKDAMSYSLKAGGKRLRPVLCMLSADMFGDMTQALDVACAIEMIHTYSLIHDDLPAMDNDVLRRGKPTNHVVFGEAFALLAGDGLLNGAFEVLLKLAQRSSLDKLDVVRAMQIISAASGMKGMIAGQAADLQFEGEDVDAQVLHYIHDRKTAAMIKASVTAGAALFHANEDDIAALGLYGDHLGLVFQIVDDILDEVGDENKLGKSIGKDKDAKKITFARLYGIDESRRIAKEKTDKAISALARFGARADRLKALATFMLDRDR
jgi:geranylgeranyl diphosphate synthase type II